MITVVFVPAVVVVVLTGSRVVRFAVRIPWVVVELVVWLDVVFVIWKLVLEDVDEFVDVEPVK
jgi:hypothetical protein